MKLLNQISLMLITSISLLGCSTTQQKTIPDTDYAIVGVNIISMLDDQVIPNQTLLIKEGRIALIGDVDSVKVEEETSIIDGTEKFLIPGLAEMHAHIPLPVKGDVSLAEETMMLFAAHGITTIRGMKGGAYHLKLKAQTASGKVVGPRIFTCGKRLNSGTVKTIEGAHQIVKEQFDAGYDFIKIHRALSPALFHAIADAADSLGIGIAGHIPETVGLKEALSRNYLSVDHFDGFMEALVPDDIEVVPFENGGLFAIPLATKVDTSKMDGLVQLTKSKNTWVVPTQAWLERIIAPIDPQVYLSESGMAYISKDKKEGWVRWKKREDEKITTEIAEKYTDIHRLLLKKMNDAGVGTLFGCDAPQFGNVPGFSMHHEVKAYQAAGLSNYDILKMATINPAIFFNHTDTFGSIKESLDADLVLLDGNPIEDMENLKRPVGVMLRGKWYSREYLDEQLEKIAMKYQ